MTDTKTIHQAVASAIGEVIQLGKSERNKFDGYNFVSIDKFLSLVNPICAKNGLFPCTSQTGIETYENTSSQGKISTWARFSFEIVLNHASGQTLPPSKITVSVAMNGAQASGSAQSYALKQFFRGMFMIPTGDKDDADFSATEPHNAPDKPARQPASKVDSIVIGSKLIIDKINKTATLSELQGIWDSLNPDFRKNPAISAAKDAKKTAITATDIGSDEIPY